MNIFRQSSCSRIICVISAPLHPRVTALVLTDNLFIERSTNLPHHRSPLLPSPLPFRSPRAVGCRTRGLDPVVPAPAALPARPGLAGRFAGSLSGRSGGRINRRGCVILRVHEGCARFTCITIHICCNATHALESAREMYWTEGGGFDRGRREWQRTPENPLINSCGVRAQSVPPLPLTD